MLPSNIRSARVFNHIPVELVDYPRTEVNGYRYYDTPDGLFPSITTVLGYGHDGFLDSWRERIGEDAANKITRQACNRGTRLHKFCEDYLQNKDISFKTPFDQLLFKSIKPQLDKISDIRAQEKPLYSKKLRVAGTVDCIGAFDGVLSIIDFKTSGELKDKAWINSYFMQTTAYAGMWYERTGEQIKQLVILIATEGGQGQVFIETPGKWFRDLQAQINLFHENA